VSAPVRHLTTEELSERTGIPAETLRSWRTQGKGLAYMRLGRLIRYRLADIEQWEEERLVRPRHRERDG
jgi:excisionase family DNA binding protein